MKTNNLFDLGRRLMVWEKGRPIPSVDPAMWRNDDFGKRLRWSDYGDHTSPFGWSIDHIFPSAIGGHDGIDNLRPLHCGSNSGLGGLLGSVLQRSGS
jgi:hypothetical protein